MAESQEVATLEGENSALLVMLRAAEKERDEARAESARLREALEWYADASQWSGYDNGARARQALAKEGT